MSKSIPYIMFWTFMIVLVGGVVYYKLNKVTPEKECVKNSGIPVYQSDRWSVTRMVDCKIYKED